MHIHVNQELVKFHSIKNELSELYMNFAIVSFAFSLVGVFVPIYLLELGYGLDAAIFYLMMHFGTIGFFSPVAGILSRKFGFKHIILYFRIPSLILYFILLYTLPFLNFGAIIFMGFAGGVSASLYWVSINSVFMRYSDHKHRAAEVSKFRLYGGLAAIIGPVIGGLLILYAGFSALFAIATIIIFISVIPLFYTGDVKPDTRFSKTNIFTARNKRFFAVFLFDGFKTVSLGLLWPILIFFSLNNIADVGFSASLISVGLLAFTAIHAFLFPRTHKHSLLKIGGLAGFFIWLAAIMPQNLYTFLILSFLFGLFITMEETGFDALTFDRAKWNKNKDEFIVMREIFLAAGRIIALVVVLFAIDKFAILFSLTALASLVYVLF